MCIIVTKKADFALPNEATLRRCFSSNPDGAGFAWSDATKVYWRKGYSTFEAFYTALKEIFPDETIEKQHAIVLHFRIGTHGPKKSPSHMHPFPVDVLTLQQTTELSGSCSMALFHNGVISDIMKTNHDKVLVDNVEVDPSDSMVLAYHYVRPMLKAFDLGAIEAKTFNMFMDHFIGYSRIALLEPAGIIDYYGSWAVEDAEYPGCLFSNTGYKYVVPVVTNYGKSYMSRNINGDNTYYNDDYWKAWDENYLKTPVKEPTNWQPTLSASKPAIMKSTTAPATFPVWQAFWESHAKTAALYTKDLVKLPIGTTISSKRQKVLTMYAPQYDGDLYYRDVSVTMFPSKKTQDIQTQIYVKQGDKFYLVGHYTIVKEELRAGNEIAQ